MVDPNPEASPAGAALPLAPGHSPRGARRTFAILLGTGFGAGYFPVAPGTAGTLLVGLPVAWALGMFAPWAGLAGAGILFIAGLWAGGDCEGVFGRRDPPRVVLDEVVGMLLAVLWIAPSWPVFLAGFVLFRACDILKPWPARSAERLRGGLGIMLDDVIAGLYARLALEACLRLFAAWGPNAGTGG